MAGAGSVILGILAGGAAVGGTLVAVDPLGARRPPGGNGGAATEEFDEQTQVDRPGQALAVLGYAPTGTPTPTDIRNFQSDVNEVLTWVRTTKAGHQRVPPPEAGFLQIPVVLQGIPAAPDLDVSGNLDVRTMMALGKVIQQATLVAGVACVTPQGQAIEASLSACQGAWEQAFRYAYEANLAGPKTGTLWTS